MPDNEHFWIHPATFTFRRGEPDTLMETVWAERPGWGYLKRRDLWMEVSGSREEMESAGYTEMKPLGSEGVRICRHCRMYMCDIPGYLSEKHITACGNKDDNRLAVEDAMVSALRAEMYYRKIAEAKQREQAEIEEAERRERQDRIRDEFVSRQSGKDRKKRIKQEAREQLRKK